MITNEMLAQFLSSVGFEAGEPAARNHRSWRHAQSGCVLLLPANKKKERPRPADLVGIKAQLDLHGHIDEGAFEQFIATGKLPVRSA
jgi:hypothetical protein